MQKVIVVNCLVQITNDGTGTKYREDLPSELNTHLEDGWVIQKSTVVTTQSNSYFSVVFELAK